MLVEEACKPRMNALVLEVAQTAILSHKVSIWLPVGKATGGSKIGVAVPSGLILNILVTLPSSLIAVVKFESIAVKVTLSGTMTGMKGAFGCGLAYTFWLILNLSHLSDVCHSVVPSGAAVRLAISGVRSATSIKS